MITVKLYKTEGQITGFLSEGHAGYAQEGYDIICSAVSVLLINAVNSVEALTEDPIIVDQKEEGGYLRMIFTGTMSDEAAVLMKSLQLGLTMIEESYGTEFLSVTEEEVSNN